MRLRRRYLWLAASLGLAAMLPTVARSVEPTPTISAYNEPGTYKYHYWMPSTATVGPGGSVIFKNSYTETSHGLKFTGGTAGSPPPSCTGLPAAAETELGAPSWEAKCTFSKSGTYTFVCTVHHEMTGTITVKNEGEPVAVTGAATPVGETGATLNGTVNPEGHETSYFFKYGRTTSYENGSTPTGKLPAVKEGKAVFAPVMGLLPGTTYHFRLFVENEKGPAEGADQTFITSGPPSATTSAATEVSETTATLKGTVDPDGKPTKYFFEWGTSESYGQVTAEAPAGEGHFSEPASAKLTGLVAGKVYHFRLVAKNASEEVRGLDQMFTTKSLSSPPTEPSPPPTTTTTPTPPPTTTTHTEPPPGPPISGSPSLRSAQRGASVKGSLDVSQLGAGGRLEVDLLAKSASLAAVRRSAAVRVGRFVRASVSAGKASFSVALTARGRSALRRHHRLALTVKITLTPTHGAAVTVTRSVVLRA
jgi:plastocyanin